MIGGPGVLPPQVEEVPPKIFRPPSIDDKVREVASNSDMTFDDSASEQPYMPALMEGYAPIHRKSIKLELTPRSRVETIKFTSKSSGFEAKSSGFEEDKYPTKVN
jgi:hypothetical protein